MDMRKDFLETLIFYSGRYPVFPGPFPLIPKRATTTWRHKNGSLSAAVQIILTVNLLNYDFYDLPDQFAGITYYFNKIYTWF